MIRLANPYFLLIGVIFLFFFVKKKSAFLGYSHLQLTEGNIESRFLQNLPQVLSTMVIALLVLGLARPQWRSVVKQEVVLARDIILVMDLSYSMKEGFNKDEGPIRIDVAKKTALQFIEKRENDRIGLLVFGDKTFGSWPLTTDLGLISKKVKRLGSTYYGGTNLVQPFLKAVEHFREMGQSTSRILVFLSDGEANIPPEKKEMIVKEIKEMGIHLYLLGINLKKHENDLFEIVDRVQGRFITTESASEMTKAFTTIDHLEPSRFKIEVQGESQELYPIFILLSLGLLLILTFLHNTLFIELC